MMWERLKQPNLTRKKGTKAIRASKKGFFVAFYGYKKDKKDVQKEGKSGGNSRDTAKVGGRDVQEKWAGLFVTADP